MLLTTLSSPLVDIEKIKLAGIKSALKGYLYHKKTHTICLQRFSSENSEGRKQEEHHLTQLSV